ncbi:RND transporter [Amylibacter ulvae]|uniref:RND transporter n=1 Tax=Paramylibacter ulvae TaxID=1651968 RepID=A0ABQ3D6G8_9RHOB|nr:efflux RND transporter periplasmic adaptor subunit [Amylibacter ulvae]GHA58542.1 RND transporter [Amylibacter ulvae]
MKQLLSILAGAAILIVAYVFTFGIPDRIVKTIGFSDSNETTASSGGGANGAAGRSGRGGGATTVVLAPLEEQSHTLVLRTIGSATSLSNVDVVTSDSGEIVAVSMEPNVFVEKGDVLLRLDDRAQRLAVEIAQTERDDAKSTVDRYTSLRSGGNLTISDVAASDAEVALRLAESNLALAQVALDDRTIRAPISGTLGLTTLEEGTYVSAGDTVVTIDDSTVLIAQFEVPERSISLLERGKKVLIGTPTYAGRVFEGSITAFDSRLDSVTRSATVHAQIDNTDGLLLSGMTFTVRMNEDTAPLPVVPSTAITWDRNGAGIWVSTNGKVSRHSVAIRYREGDQIWVETDVPLGASIVAEGAAKLREGAQVSDANATGKPNS